MTFKGKTDKGRYNKLKMTKDHYNCLSLKKQLRIKYLDYIKNDKYLIEPFAGNEELYNSVYKNYNLKKRVALDIEPNKKHIIKYDANKYPEQNNIYEFNIIDLDHHKLEVLQTFKIWSKYIKGECVVFLTFGIAAFARKSFVKESTVYYNGDSNKKIQVNHKMSYYLPSNYIKNCLEDNNFKLLKFDKIRYKHIVSYYALHIKKNEIRQ